MIYLRNVYSALLEHLALKQITVLTGMRRTGKTTLVKQLMEASGVPFDGWVWGGFLG